MLDAKSRKAYMPERKGFLQTDAPIHPGNSSGALIDRNGTLVGINGSIIGQAGGVLAVGVVRNGQALLLRIDASIWQVRAGMVARGAPRQYILPIPWTDLRQSHKK